jgi:hypothetical protein
MYVKRMSNFRQIDVKWNWNGMELYKGCYIQYSIEDWISDDGNSLV